MAAGQVHEAHGDIALQRKTQGAIFGREGGEGVEGRPLRFIGPVDEQGHRHHQRRMGQPGDDRIGVGRALDEDTIRLIGGQPASKARAVPGP